MDSKKKKKKSSKKRQELLEQKNKMLKSVTFIFVIAIIIVFGWLLLVKNKSYVKEFENSYLSFSYDTTGQVSKQNTGTVSLTHKTNCFIDIKVTNLSNNLINSDVKTISDEVRYDVVDSYDKLIEMVTA